MNDPDHDDRGREGSAGAALPPGHPARREPPPKPAEKARRAIELARLALLGVALLQLLATGWLAANTFGAEAVHLEPEPRLLDPRAEVPLSFGLAVVFLGLWYGSRDAARPRLTLSLGFVLYLAITALALAQDPLAALRGVVVKLIVLVLLGLGARAAFSAAPDDEAPANGAA